MSPATSGLHSMDRVVKKDWIETNKGTRIPWPPEDWLGTSLLAHLQAEQINAYWAAKGKIANAWVETVMYGNRPIYQIRSTMLNGMP